jgi:hypothetical protein
MPVGHTTAFAVNFGSVRRAALNIKDSTEASR